MATSTTTYWAVCHDGHTTIAGTNADQVPVSEMWKWTGTVNWTIVGGAR